MTNSTEYFWSIDGVSLQTYAFNISTWGGDAQSPPPLRGNDTTVPYVVGDQYHRKVPGARTVSFGMWVIGANEDGSLPVGGSSRRLFEENWRALRKLMWNPNRQVKLTKRFRDWETGEVVEATALAEFAGGLTPTMNGSQRAVFTVQFKLADPFFYGEAQTISINAMQEVARNYATNPNPVQDTFGYSTVIPAGITEQETTLTRVDLGNEDYVEAFYLNQPTTKEGGVSFGGGTSKAMAATPGLSKRYSAKFMSRLAGKYQVAVRYMDASLATLSTAVVVPELTAPANSWVTTTPGTATVPAGSVYEALEFRVHPTTGSIPKSCAINRATNPDFAAESGYLPKIVNLFPNSSFEYPAYGSTKGAKKYRNVFANSALELPSSEQRVVYNLLTNPKFGNGPKGWFVSKGSAVRPGNSLHVGSGGPVDGTRMTAYITPGTVGGMQVSTSYAGSGVSGESQDRYGTKDGVARLGVGKYYGSGWVYCPGGSQTVKIQLIEKRTDGTVVATTEASAAVTNTWVRLYVSAEKKESATTLHLGFYFATADSRLYISGCMLTNSNAFAGYFDGDGYQTVPTGRADASLYPAPNGVKWAGARNSTHSIMTMPVPSGFNIPAEIIGYVTSARRTIAGSVYTDKALYLARADRADTMHRLNEGVMIYTTTEADIGQMLTVVAEAEIPDGYVATGDSGPVNTYPSRSVFVSDFGVGPPDRGQAPATPGVHTVRMKFTPTEVGQIVRLSGGGSAYAAMGWKTVTIVRGDYEGPAFNGNRKGADTTTGPWNGATPAWDGGSPWTPSALEVTYPHLTTSVNSIVVARGVSGNSSGKYSLEVNRGPSGTAKQACAGTMIDYYFEKGKTYTVAVRGTIPAGYDASEDVFVPKEAAARSIYSQLPGLDVLETMPATPGSHVLTATFTPTEDQVRISLGGGGLLNQSVYWDDLTIVEGNKRVHPFSGHTATVDSSVRYTWTGVADNSPTQMSVAHPIGIESPVNDIFTTKVGPGVFGAHIANTDKDPATNYAVFTGTDDIFGYEFEYEAYTVMLTVDATSLGVDANASSRRLQLTLLDGTVMESPQFAANGITNIRWQFDTPESAPVELRLNVGTQGGSVEVSKFAVIPVKYDGPFFSGNSPDATWWGVANASESQLYGDRYYLTKVLVTPATYTGPYFDGDTPNTGTGDNSKTYAWVGTPYASESIHSAVNLNGVDVDVRGDFYTRKIQVVATPPVASYSIVSKTPDIEPQGYAYTEGVKTKVTVDVEKFTVAVVGDPGDKSWAVEPTRSGYWLELSPGTNTLLLRGVGTGKLEVTYRAAWI